MIAMLSLILCLAKVKYNMITTYAQYYAVSSRIEQIKNAPSGSEAAKELKILTGLMSEFESSSKTSSWCSSRSMGWSSYRKAARND